jgi:hypothetical protein
MIANQVLVCATIINHLLSIEKPTKEKKSEEYSINIIL